MGSFDCDLDRIRSAKALLENSEDGRDEVCRLVIFKQVEESESDRQNFSDTVSSLTSNLLESSACSGRLVQYESSFVLLLETSFSHSNTILQYFARHFDEAYVCVSQEGVGRVFDSIEVMSNANTSSQRGQATQKCDSEVEAANALALVTRELLTEEPDTVLIEENLLSLDHSAVLFTCKEFLEVYDIETHICKVVEHESPQIEELLIQHDELRSLSCS